DLALGGCQPLQGAVELWGQALAEYGVAELRVVAAVRLLAPLPPGLRPEPVDRGGVRDPAEPGARRPAARVEAAPALEGPLERLGREILRRRMDAREVDEVAVDCVEMVGDDVRKGRRAHVARRL